MRTLRLPRFSLPLVAKELVELSNRRRTYVVRVVYAVLLFLFAMLLLYDLMGSGAASPFLVLGRGRELFQMLVMLQFAGIAIFLPALVCGAVSGEKEANSLQLLLITDLGPWEILLSKLASRLVPMLTFLLLGMPLLAIAYAFGGVTPVSLFAAVAMLLGACFQVGCLCLLASAWCSTTASAFILSYLLGLALYAGPPVAYSIVWAIAGQVLRIDDDVTFGLFPVYHFVEMSMQWGTTPSVWEVVWRSLPVVASGVVFLGLARAVFVRRALLPPKSALRAVFGVFDGIFDRANRVTGGVVLIKDRGSLPGDRPVTWLETHQRALSKARYLIRILVLLLAPVLVVVSMMLAFEPMYSNQAEGLSVLLFLLWPVAALILAVQASSSFAAERRRQTLDVLLTTPMTGPEIVREKAAALGRLALVLALPLVVTIGFEAWWEHGMRTRSGHDDGTALYLVASLLSVAVYLPLVGWLSLLIGMAVKGPMKAMLASLAVLVGWVGGLPLAMVLVAEAFFPYGWDEEEWMGFLVASPASILPFIEFDAMDEFELWPWGIVGVNFAIHGLLLVSFRGLCLRYADRLLGRV